MANIEIVSEIKGSVAIVRIKGDLFMAESESLRAATTEIIHSGYKNIVINLAGVNYIGSSGIGALIGLYNSLKKLGGRMIAASVPGKVVEVLELMNLSMLEIMDSEAQALKAFADPNSGGQ